MMRSAGVAAVAALALLLSGCSGSAAQPTPTVASVTSSQANEQFHRQAEVTWRAFFTVSTSALRDSNVPPSDLKPYATEAEYSYVANQIRQFRDQGLRVSGSVVTRGFVVQSESADKLVALACVDNGVSKVLDSRGRDVTQSSRSGAGTVRVVAVRQAGKVVIDRDSPWTEKSVC